MKRKIVLLLLLVLIGIGNVEAACYKWTNGNGDINYYTSYDSWMTTNGGKVESVDESFCSVNSGISKVSCGNVTNIPKKIPELTSDIVMILQIAVPIILIIMGSIDLLKGVMASKEDEIKKGQQMLIKRLVNAAIIFFVVVIVKFVISIIADSTNTANIVECIDCFISGVDNCK